MQFLVAENGAVIGIIVTDGIFGVQIRLVDGLRGSGYSQMRNFGFVGMKKSVLVVDCDE